MSDGQTKAELARREQDVAQAEALLDRREHTLEQTIRASRVHAGEVALGLAGVNDAIATGLAMGGDVERFTRLAGRMDGVVIPALDLDAHRERAIDARVEAVRARDWVVGVMERELERFTDELGQVEQSLATVRAMLARLGHVPARARPATRKGMRIAVATRPDADPPRLRLVAAIDEASPCNFFTPPSGDVGRGGVFVGTECVAPLGTDVDLSFTMPGGIEIHGRGVVCWVRPPTPGVHGGLGVKFAGLDGAARDAIENFIVSRAPIVWTR